MNPLQASPTDPLNTDDLNELEIEAAAQKIALETSPENARIAVLDEADGAGGRSARAIPLQAAETIAKQQVDADNDAADLEQRIVTVINQRTKE